MEIWHGTNGCSTSVEVSVLGRSRTRRKTLLLPHCACCQVEFVVRCLPVDALGLGLHAQCAQALVSMCRFQLGRIWHQLPLWCCFQPRWVSLSQLCTDAVPHWSWHLWFTMWIQRRKSFRVSGFLTFLWSKRENSRKVWTTALAEDYTFMHL